MAAKVMAIKQSDSFVFLERDDYNNSIKVAKSQEAYYDRGAGDRVER